MILITLIYRFASKWGTVRSVYATLDSGEKYWVPTHGDVIHFRLEKRQELMLDFSNLSPQTVIAIVGKLLITSIFLPLGWILIFHFRIPILHLLHLVSD